MTKTTTQRVAEKLNENATSPYNMYFFLCLLRRAITFLCDTYANSFLSQNRLDKAGYVFVMTGIKEGSVRSKPCRLAVKVRRHRSMEIIQTDNRAVGEGV